MKGSKVLESGSFLNFATHTLHPVYLPIILSFWQSSEALLRVLRTFFFFIYEFKSSFFSLQSPSFLTDPFSMAPQKALETIGKSLSIQYERWQPKVRKFLTSTFYFELSL
jgi:hypothetical protein